jgi:hypothetical protein
MRMRNSLGLAALALAASVAAPVAARAAESRTPICGPVTITASGTYVLTRDVTIDATHPFSVLGGTVTLDLNGHTIADPSGALNVVRVSNAQLTLRNGHLSGGANSVAIDAVSAPATTVDLDRLELGNAKTGVNASGPARLTLTNSTIRSQATAVLVALAGPSMQIRITGNDLRSSARGIDLAGTTQVSGAVIENNTIVAGAEGIVVEGQHEAASIRDNTVASGNGSAIYAAGGGGHVIESNTVRRSAGAGIEVTSNYVRVLSNTVTVAGNDGIRIWGQGNAVESNLVGGCAGYGLALPGTGNVYRNNASRGNSAGAYNAALGNTDGGGNQ